MAPIAQNQTYDSSVGGSAAVKQASELATRLAVSYYVTPSPQGIKWGMVKSLTMQAALGGIGKNSLRITV